MAEEGLKTARLTREQRWKSVVETVMGAEEGRQFVLGILREFSPNRSPVPGTKGLKVQTSLPAVEALIYNTGQQDVIRWLMGECTKYAPAHFREASVESYIRREHEEEP